MNNPVPVELLLQQLLAKDYPDTLNATHIPQNFAGWWASSCNLLEEWSLFDRAVLEGFHADCAAFAFGSGYQAALHRLVPTLSNDKVAAFAITEEGGGHPRAILATLLPDLDLTTAWRISGFKKWVSLAIEADFLLAAASVGVTPRGRNQIRIVRVAKNMPGVTITPMRSVSIVPEISHGEVSFDNVLLMEEDLLPDDGYVNYIRPFRTLEDIFVCGSLTGYIIRIARAFLWPNIACEVLLGLIVALRALSEGDPTAPSLHVALGGVLSIQREIFERVQPLWDKVDPRIRAAWVRDAPLLNVAAKVREARLARAWEKV